MAAPTPPPAHIDVTRDGYTPLPRGRLAAAVTYLEQRTPPAPRPEPAHADLALDRLRGGDLARYRALFRAVGEPWLWFGRTLQSDAELTALLDDDAIEALALVRAGRDIGLLELDARDCAEVELAYFGVVPDAVGRGLGRWLMNRALERAWAHGPRRVFVHTCSFDHPDALAFYIRSGFVPYARAVEIAADPRLSGHLPRQAAPHVPVIDD